MKLTLAILSLSLASVAFADHDGSHPCKALKAACEAGGYTRGHHKEDKKGLAIDCMKPLLAGEKVAGVSANPSDIEGCKAKHAEHQAKKKK